MSDEAPNRKLPDGTLGGPVIGRGVRSAIPEWSVGPRHGRMHLTHADDEAALCGVEAPKAGWFALLTEGERSGNGDYCTTCATNYQDLLDAERARALETGGTLMSREISLTSPGVSLSITDSLAPGDVPPEEGR